MDKISVVVPSYNNAPWLPQCLESILSQTYENLEIIVVDDGSTDDTPRILETFTSKSSKIIGIRQKNSGVTAARLRGVAAASGEWIGFVDADDVVDPGLYARLHENARSYDVDISHCGYQLLLPDGAKQPHGGTGDLRLQDRLTGLRDLLEERIVEPGLCVKLFRRRLFNGLDAWMDRSIRNNEDMLMNYYLFSQANRAVFQDVCLYYYRVREESASRSKLNDNQIFDPLRVRCRILEECEPELKDTAREALIRYALYCYAQLAMQPTNQFCTQRQAIRLLIQKEKQYYHLLIPRNRLLCRMICLSPLTFRIVFRGYVALVLHGRY